MSQKKEITVQQGYAGNGGGLITGRRARLVQRSAMACALQQIIEQRALNLSAVKSRTSPYLLITGIETVLSRLIALLSFTPSTTRAM